MTASTSMAPPAPTLSANLYRALTTASLPLVELLIQ